MTEEAMDEGVDYCGYVKTSHKGFYLDTLEKMMKYWPGGSYLVMKSTPRVPVGRPLMDIGYNYNSRKVLGFIATEGGVSTETGDIYLSCFPEKFLMLLFAPFFFSLARKLFKLL